MVMHHHEPVCLDKKLFHQGQGHSEDLYDQNMISSNTSSELLIPLQPNLICCYFTIKPCLNKSCEKIGLLLSRSQLLVQNLNEYLTDLTYIFCTTDIFNNNDKSTYTAAQSCLEETFKVHTHRHWHTGAYVCNQTRCVDVLLLTTRPNANKVGVYTDNNINSDLHWL